MVRETEVLHSIHPQKYLIPPSPREREREEKVMREKVCECVCVCERERTELREEGLCIFVLLLYNLHDYYIFMEIIPSEARFILGTERVCMASLQISKTSCSLWHSDTTSIFCSKDFTQSDVSPLERQQLYCRTYHRCRCFGVYGFFADF